WPASGGTRARARPSRRRLLLRGSRRRSPICACASMVPFALWCDDEPVGGAPPVASPGVCGGDAAVDVDDVSGGLRRARAGEEGDRLRDVLRVDVDAETRPAPVEAGQVLGVDAVRARALGLPVGRP